MNNRNIYFKQLVSVFGGTAIAQIIPIIGSLIIARLYSPQDFGLFASWLSITTILSIFISLRYELALGLVDDGFNRQSALFAISIVCVITTIIAFLLLGFIYLSPIKNNIPFNSFSLLLLIPTALFIATNQVWQSAMAADGTFKKLNYSRIFQAALITILQILLGIKFARYDYLCLGLFLGSLLSQILMMILTPCYTKNDSVGTLWQSGRQFLKQYKNFPLISLPSDSLNTLSTQLPTILVAMQFGAEKAGFLALTLRVLSAPLAILGKAVFDVYRRYASLSFRQTGNCRKEYSYTFKILCIASLLFTIATIFLAEPIFILAFGEEWKMSGTIALWLLPLFAMRFIASPLSYTILLAQKQHIDLIWQFGLLLLTILAFYVSQSFKISIISYSIFYAIMYIIYLFISYRLSKIR